MKKVFVLLFGVLLVASHLPVFAEEEKQEDKKDPKTEIKEEDFRKEEIKVKTDKRKFIGKTPEVLPPLPTDKPVVGEPKIKKPSADFSELFLQAVNFENQEKYVEAIAVYNEALEVRREAPGAIIRKGICQIRIGLKEAGVTTILEGLDMKPVTKGDYMTMSWVKSTAPVAQLRDGTLAVVYAQRVLESGETPEGLDLLAAGYAEMGNFQQAREALMRAIKTYPDAPNLDSIRKRLDLNTNRQKYREEWTENKEVKLDNEVEDAEKRAAE
jgi:tetratricopeptide (TPR) repeat protein